MTDTHGTRTALTMIGAPLTVLITLVLATVLPIPALFTHTLIAGITISMLRAIVDALGLSAQDKH